MGVTKNIALSSTHVQRVENPRKALKKVSADLIVETKALNSYLIVSDL